MLTLEHTIAQKPGQIVSNMGDEKVMLSIENGKYYNLGAIGGEIWELIMDPVTVEHVVEQLLERYEIEKQTCAEQVQHFLNDLLKEGLITAQL